MPWLRPYDLRRSAARNLLHAGVQEDVAMKLCGLETRCMLTRYNVTATADLAEGVGRVGAFLERSGVEVGTNAAQNPTDENAVSEAGAEAAAASAKKKWCDPPESNWGHRDFQSRALPTELGSHRQETR